MINRALQVARHRDVLESIGRIQIQEFLDANAAAQLLRCLQEDVPWSLAFRGRNGDQTLPSGAYTALPANGVASLFAEIAASGRTTMPDDDGFRYAYDTYMMVEAYKAGEDPGLLLHRVLEFLNAPPYLDFVRSLTGERRVRRVSAQATRYRPGQFLRRHSDANSHEGRLFAYVINLTPAWQADWGGLLQFIDDAGAVVDTFVPRWNSLSLFRVPADHAVSMVQPWAPENRLSITGWLLT